MMRPSDRTSQPFRPRECALEYRRARSRELTFTQEEAGLTYPQEKETYCWHGGSGATSTDARATRAPSVASGFKPNAFGSHEIYV